MKKENVVIDIAGLPLGVKNRHDVLSQPIFKKFLDKRRKSSSNIRHLNSISSKYPVSNTPFFNGKLVSYACSKLLASNDGMLLHATAVAKDKKAFIFLGIGGSGKSTIASLSKRYKVLGDDVIAIRKNGRHYYAFSTPWKQAPFIIPDRHSKSRISAIFFIKKSSRISFKFLQPEYALMRILSNHIHFLACMGKPLADKIFYTATDFVRGIPAYEMEFTKTRDFWRTLEEETSAVRP